MLLCVPRAVCPDRERELGVMLSGQDLGRGPLDRVRFLGVEQPEGLFHVTPTF